MEFTPGMKTYMNGKIAYLIECINQHDPEDIKIQGKRWYVDSGGYRWSVTEDYLREFRWC